MIPDTMSRVAAHTPGHVNEGIRRGIEMTFRRIESCKIDVPLGTYDPVPPVHDLVPERIE